MSLTRIQRINIDSTNFEYKNTNVSLRVATPVPIIKVPEEYNVVLEKAEIPISKIPLNVIQDPLYIMIDYPPGAPDHPVLEKKLNIFTIQGEYYSVAQFVAMVNKIIHGDLGPSVSCGLFSYNTTTHRIEYKFGDSVDRTTLGLGVEMWFDNRLMYLLDGIPNLFASAPDLGLSSSLKMHKVTWNTYLGGEAGVVLKEQQSYLIPRLFGFKSIRISSSLPTPPYIIYDQQADKANQSNLLSEIMMDSQNFVEGRSNQLYIPQNLIFNALTGVTPLTEFQLWFHIHYKNGVNYGLTVQDNEYLSVTLAFYKI